MAEASINELHPELSYDTPELDVKLKKLIECVLTGNSQQYLVKAYTEEQVSKPVLKKWISYLAITKLNSQVKW